MKDYVWNKLTNVFVIELINVKAVLAVLPNNSVVFFLFSQLLSHVRENIHTSVKYFQTVIHTNVNIVVKTYEHVVHPPLSAISSCRDSWQWDGWYRLYDITRRTFWSFLVSMATSMFLPTYAGLWVCRRSRQRFYMLLEDWSHPILYFLILIASAWKCATKNITSIKI